MSKVLSNQEFLRYLCNCKSKQQKLIIKNATKDQINAICEIILNILNGNLKINELQFKKFSSKKSVLRQIVNKNSLKKKKYLIQKGGFLQLLIPSIISGLATVVASIINKS